MSTIADACGDIDYQECGDGPAVVLVPGSCSPGAAWRPVMSTLDNCFRCVTTSLLGYGGTAERRALDDASIWHEVDALEAVIRKAGDTVHLVGHSFGGLVAIAMALRERVLLASLTVAPCRRAFDKVQKSARPSLRPAHPEHRHAFTPAGRIRNKSCCHWCECTYVSCHPGNHPPRPAQ